MGAKKCERREYLRFPTGRILTAALPWAERLILKRTRRIFSSEVENSLPERLAVSSGTNFPLG